MIPHQQLNIKFSKVHQKSCFKRSREFEGIKIFLRNRKVRKSQKQFLELTILPKNKRKA